MHKTRDRLIKVYQTKSKIETANQVLTLAQDRKQTDGAKKKVKNIVAGGITHQAFGHNKAQNSG